MKGALLAALLLTGCVSVRIESPCLSNEIRGTWGILEIRSCTRHDTSTITPS